MDTRAVRTEMKLFFFFFLHTPLAKEIMLSDAPVNYIEHHQDLKKYTCANCYAIWTNSTGHLPPAQPEARDATT